MGIIVRNIKSNQIIFYSKGAENVIEESVKEDYKSYIRENSENLACMGLRTLVITQKLLEKSFYDKWIKEYYTACVSMENRKEKINSVIKLLENNMEFLTVTGVEDQLQEEVNETIDSLKNAGIKIWMLTGDKVETALCIAISTGLKAKDQKVGIIKENNSLEYVKNSLEKMRYIGEYLFVIDGVCLEVALTQLEKLFFEIASKVFIEL
jgi:phospholipid-translocating ATPase